MAVVRDASGGHAIARLALTRNLKAFAPLGAIRARENHLHLLRTLRVAAAQYFQHAVNVLKPRIVIDRTRGTIEPVECGSHLQESGAHLQKFAVQHLGRTERTGHQAALLPNDVQLAAGHRQTTAIRPPPRGQSPHSLPGVDCAPAIQFRARGTRNQARLTGPAAAALARRRVRPRKRPAQGLRCPGRYNPSGRETDCPTAGITDRAQPPRARPDHFARVGSCGRGPSDRWNTKDKLALKNENLSTANFRTGQDRSVQDVSGPG